MSNRFGVTVLAAIAAIASISAQPSEATKQFQQLTAAETEYRRVTFPEEATLESDHRFNTRWNDYSIRRRDPAVAHARQGLAQLAAIDPTRLSEQDALSHELLRRQYALEIESHRFPEDYLLIDQMRGRQLDTPEVLASMPRGTAADFETILVRLDALPAVLKQWEALLRDGLSKGVTPPQAAIGELPQQVLQQVTGADALATPIMAPFASIPNTIDAESAKLLRQRAMAVFTQKVKPAYESFHRFLADTYVPGARRTNGFTDLPDGAAWYALELRRHTTTSLTTRELHDDAMRTIDQLVSEMQAVMKTVGFKGTVEGFRKHVEANQPPLASTADVLREYRDIAKRVDPLLPQYFRVLPRTPFGIEPIPAFRGAAVPYYQGPPPDGSRAANFFVPADPKRNPRWRMVTYVLHEGVPGHHLERALFAEERAIPGFRRSLEMTAYVEGWAMYADHTLGQEMGFYNEPYARYGFLASRMISATGIAVDTGMNALGWTRERAIEFLRTHRGGSEMEYAVNRVTAWPGQIMSYSVGADVILRLRGEMKALRGDRFDIREFHDVVLRDGPMPLDLLEQRVKKYYAATK